MEEIKFVVSQENSGQRLDKFLVKALDGRFTRSFIKKLIDEKRIVVNGDAVKPHTSVSLGDAVCITVPEPRESVILPENIPVDIVHEDEDIIVVNKPAGLVVHPAPGNYTGTLVNALLYHCKNLSGIGGVIRPGIVHRLDKDTSGLIVAAKTDLAFRSLAAQFNRKKAGRIYTAVVKGIVQLDNGIIELPIGRHPRDRQRMGVTFSNSREAYTVYEVIKRLKDFTVLRVKLGTGRTHQIRVHMAHIGHPVLGDRKYGSGRGMDRQALHAKILSFNHPRTRDRVVFESNLPDDMVELIRKGEAALSR